MTTHRTETGPPAERRRTTRPPERRGRDWGRTFARVLCAVLATLGVTPFATVLLVRSTWARAWATRETERALREQGIEASYEMALRVWPVAVELTHLRVDSTDGGAAALECERVRIRPKLFGLLAGKLAIDQVELDQPRVRVVARGREVANLHLKPSAPSKGPVRSVFGTLALTDASFDVALDGVHVQAHSVDLDITADDEAGGGSAFEAVIRVGRAVVESSHARTDGSLAVDEDVLCSTEARVRIQSDGVLVRRLAGVGAADLDGAQGTTPGCDLPADDKHRVELSMGGVHVLFPRAAGGMPAVDGQVAFRTPIALAERAGVAGADGWMRFDGRVRYDDASVLPEVSGTLEAHDARLGRYLLAEELRSDLTVRHNIVESHLTTVRLAGGTVILADTVLDPLARGVRLERTSLDATGVDFTALLRALGVNQNPRVAWDVRELHLPLVSGRLAPLKLDGELTGKTANFGVYDRPADDHARERLFGFSEAQIAAHLAVRPDGMKFVEVRAVLPHSRIDGGMVSLGFDSDLRIEVPHVSADLSDISPIGPVPMRGQLEGSAHVGGLFNRPEPQGDIQAITGFVVAGIAFGDVSSGHVDVDVEKPEVTITGVRAKRRDSAYEVPTAKLRFGGVRGFAVDAVGASAGLGFRDLLSMFELDDDPRFAGIDATIATRADVHVALGGPEDACGGGYVGVDLKGHLSNVHLYGERFAQGDADLSLRWYDREQGIAGADVDVRSFVLNKIQPPSGTRGGVTGTLLGSAAIHRGGALAANVMIEGVPLSRVDALGAFGREVDGIVSGVAHVTGDLDDFHADAGFVARGGIDITGTRVRGVALPSSHVDVGMTHRMARQKRMVGRTRCGSPIGPPFDKAAYLADPSVQEDWTVDGDLLGGTARLRDVVITRGRPPRAIGRISLRGVDLGPLGRIFLGRRPESEEAIAVVSPASARSAIGGQIWGELVADDIRLDDLSKSRVRFLLGPTVVSRGGQKVMLQPPRDPLELAGDTLTIPSLELSLDTPEGFRGGCVLAGNVTKVTTDPTLALEARLQPMDLAILERLVPKVERAVGTVVGSVRVTGRAASPILSGEVHVTAEAIEVHGLPSAVTEVRLDARATSNELDVSGVGKFAGGTVAIVGAMPVRGFAFGILDSSVVARGIRLTPADGIAATFDADLQVSYDPKGRGTDNAGLPRVTGDVMVSSFAYTRPISLTTDLTALGGRAKRTEIDAYEPSLDFVGFDLRLRSREPLTIKNNLVEAQLAVDSGTLEVTGTNQRLGLRGALRTLPGGRFHFQQSDFEVRQGLIRFEDPTRVAANVDVTAVTEYRRYTDTSAATAAGVGTGGGPTATSIGSTRGGSLWRITLHAYGDAEDLRVDMTSEPTLSREDIVLLLAVGMTHAELDQLQASSLGASLALNYLGATSGADRAVKQALPIIDDFRFGSAYSTVTGKTEPQLTVGKRLTNDLRASVTTGLSGDRELRSNIEWRLNNQLSVQGSYDNINDVSSSTLGNLGVDLRWRLEFE